MNKLDDQVQTLMGLGLTLLQAQTYLTLAKLGKANVKTIAKYSNIARQDIYRIMPALQKLGLGETIISKPTVYKATPIKEGLSILLQNREQECIELQDKVAWLINTFHTNNVKIDSQEEENTQFMITSEATLFLKMQKNLHQKAQKSIDIMVPLIFSPTKLFEILSNLNEVARKGVKIRLVTQKAEKKLTSKELQTMEKNSLCEIKYLTTPIPFGMHIFDKNEVTLSLSEKSGLPSLWSNNLNLIKIATTYFDEMWREAQYPTAADTKRRPVKSGKMKPAAVKPLNKGL